jgi:hypothetical protein
VTKRNPSTQKERCTDDGEIQVDIIPGPATPEQKQALKKFMDWYKTKVVSNLMKKKSTKKRGGKK